MEKEQNTPRVPVLGWNSECFFADGKPMSLVSGEFHYFRVPKRDWRARLQLLLDAGMNTAATYIPWIVHEPEEGQILFDDVPERSLTDFLQLCTEMGIMVIARPGPYSYSELCRDGLPTWLSDRYPEIIAHGANKRGVPYYLNPSYLHPVFLEKARRYIRQVDEVIKPYLVTNGGCIVSVQADNEVGGVHIWRGFLDCNKEGCGIGRADGHYVRFLSEKYGTVSFLNERYGTAYADFTDVLPFENTPADSTLGGKRFMTDYADFYKFMMEIYVKTVCDWLYEDGIDVPLCLNAGCPEFIPFMREMPRQNAEYSLFLGVDHYYALAPSAGNAPTPEKMLRYARSMDMLEVLGMPPSVLEMQCGSASAYPPMFPEHLLAFYMGHVAYGMKGSNYYVFTGGPNFADTGSNCEIYDYHAPVSATGEIRPIYSALKERDDFSHTHPALLTTPRSYDLQIGVTWELMYQGGCGPCRRYAADNMSALRILWAQELALGFSGRLVKYREIGSTLDPEKPLLVVTDDRMAKEKQEALVQFVKTGGKLILTPTVPVLDEDFLPCTVLAEYLGVTGVRRLDAAGAVTLSSGEKVYEFTAKYTFDGFAGEPLAFDDTSRAPVAAIKRIGAGAVVLLGAAFEYKQFPHMDLTEHCLAALDAGRCIETDSKTLLFSLFTYGEGGMLFVMNFLTGAQRVNLTVTAGGKIHRITDLSVPAMSVVPVQL